MKIRLIEEFWNFGLEFWPGQIEGLRTARIEVIDPNERWPIEVGRITCEDPLFCQLYDILDGMEIQDENN